jgi:hypothetical protein
VARRPEADPVGRGRRPPETAPRELGTAVDLDGPQARPVTTQRPRPGATVTVAVDGADVVNRVREIDLDETVELDAETIARLVASLSAPEQPSPRSAR